jgi:hypothetical protein
MIPQTVPELVARAADHPFLGEHLALGEGIYRDTALARFDGLELASAYEPIFDISVHALAQSLSAAPDSVDRFGDELGFQAVTLRRDGEPFDPHCMRSIFSARNAMGYCSCGSTNAC